MKTLNNIKARLDKESAAHAETRAQLEAEIVQLHYQVDVERHERHRLELAVQTGSLPDDAKLVGMCEMFIMARSGHAMHLN